MKKILIIVLMFMLVFTSATTMAVSTRTKPIRPTDNGDISIGSIKVDRESVHCEGNIVNIKMVPKNFDIYADYSLKAPKDLPDIDIAAAVVVPIPDQEDKKMEQTFDQKDGKISFNINMDDKKIINKEYVLVGAYGYFHPNPFDPKYDFKFDFAFVSVVCVSNKLSVSSGMPTGMNYVSYIINWGDGTSTHVGPVILGNPIEASHRWIKDGNYQITVRMIGIKNTGDLPGMNIKINKENNGHNNIINKGSSQFSNQRFSPIEIKKSLFEYHALSRFLYVSRNKNNVIFKLLFPR